MEFSHADLGTPAGLARKRPRSCPPAVYKNRAVSWSKCKLCAPFRPALPMRFRGRPRRGCGSATTKHSARGVGNWSGQWADPHVAPLRATPNLARDRGGFRHHAWIHMCRVPSSQNGPCVARGPAHDDSRWAAVARSPRLRGGPTWSAMHAACTFV